MVRRRVDSRRIVWVPVIVLLLALGLASLTGVAFATIVKPLSGMVLIGMVLWWTVYEIADWNPYRY